MTTWEDILKTEITKPYFAELASFIRIQRKVVNIFPRLENMFAAFEITEFDKIKVVILGQDPYYGDNQANGLAFAVNPAVNPPPSLVNIFKERYEDVGIGHNDLAEWAKQGVLLLNVVLTVEKDKPGSHANRGWEYFTTEIIKQISQHKEHIVFLLWGNFAKSRKPLIDTTKHLILESVHPSPLSAYNGFFGCKHFSKTNDYLKQNNIETIKW